METDAAEKEKGKCFCLLICFKSNQRSHFFYSDFYNLKMGKDIFKVSEAW